MVFAIFVCTHLLAIPSAMKGQTPYWFPAVFAFSLGFVSGFFAPYLYRRARDEEPRGLIAAHAQELILSARERSPRPDVQAIGSAPSRAESR
jgi:hypothetical protein